MANPRKFNKGENFTQYRSTLGDNEDADDSALLSEINIEDPPPAINRKQLSQRLLSILEHSDTTQHVVHPVFSQMDELVDHHNDFEWHETARWIKFEENVEDGGNRWSKPHVASLALHAVFELKNLIRSGTVILDLEAGSLEQIVNYLTDELVTSGHLNSNKRHLLRDVLLKKHRHQHQRKNHVLRTIRNSSIEGAKYLIEPDNLSNARKKKKSQELITEMSAQIVKTTESNRSPSPQFAKPNKQFMHKIPAEAEASSVMLAELDFLDKPICAFIRLKSSFKIDNLVEVPVKTRFIFLLLTPKGDQAKNSEEIARSMGTLMSDEIFQEVAYKSRTPNHIIVGIDEFLTSLTVLPPAEWDPTIRIEPPNSVPSQELRRRFIEESSFVVDEEELEQKEREESGLARSGILFGGLVNDIKRKVPFYLSDFKDALSMQCIASWVFLYFACLSPIITFGGLLAHATGNNMAAMESLVSGFVCGVGYGLFSGQPLSILGSTGPVLVFEKIVYTICMSNDWNYMSFRFWIGTWTAVILLILVAIDASAYVCYITRFTEENFAILIAFIFVVEAVQNVAHIGDNFPINAQPPGNCSCIGNNGSVEFAQVTSLADRENCLSMDGVLEGFGCDTLEYVPNVFLMSVLLFLGTFLISWFLKKFKNALFFSSTVRQYISDFAVLIAILSMTLLDYSSGVATPKLQVPSEFKPTLPTRGWLIPPFNGNPAYTIFLAIPPAILGTILIFMDQQITAVIMNRREHKLNKKCGYHLDLFVLAILIQICSFMGIPWFVAATVLSINHVNSLKLESECSAPGEKPQFLGVREQRLTNVVIFLTIGLSVFLTPLLGHIPMPVLFGVFLYMGLASLDGLQFWNRILLIFMPKKYQPDYPYLRQVPIGRVHLFTMIQLSCLASLWIIKSFSQTSILFPMMLVVMVGIRKALDFVFTQRELKSLDNLIPKPKLMVKKENMTWQSKLSNFILGPKLILDCDKGKEQVALKQTKTSDC